MKKNSPTKNLAGFTLIELLVVIAIIAVILGFSFPALRKASATAKATKCLTQLRQSGGVLQISAVDYGDRIFLLESGPGSHELRPYFVIAEATGDMDFNKVQCPSAPKRRTYHWHIYGVNFADTPSARAEWVQSPHIDSRERQSTASTMNLAIVTEPSRVILMADSSNAVGDQVFRVNKFEGDIALRHNDRANVVFLDGSARALSLEELKEYEIRAAYTFEDGPKNKGERVGLN